MFTAQTWPIAANMFVFGNTAPGGGYTKDAPATFWARQLREVKRLGMNAIDPSDAWIPLVELSDARLGELIRVLESVELEVPSISMTRRSIVDDENGDLHMEEALKLIHIAARLGARIVNIGFMQALTPPQEQALWFWLAPGHVDRPEKRDLAVERTRYLGEQAAKNGIRLSLEMYEDTFVGTPDEAVQFIADVGHPAVGLNPDLGNLIRLHKPIEPYTEMFEKVLPFSNFWHIKNYTRDFDPNTGAYATAPVPLKYGYINYRSIIQMALEMGFNGPFCCEHYGSDSLGVVAENYHYIRDVLQGALAS